MTALLGLFANRRLLGLLAVGALALGVVVYVLVLRADVADLTARNAQLEADKRAAVEAAQANLLAYEASVAEHERQVAALKTERDAMQRRVAKIESLKGETLNAKPDEDGAVAPVLRRALDGLRRPE